MWYDEKTKACLNTYYYLKIHVDRWKDNPLDFEVRDDLYILVCYSRARIHDVEDALIQYSIDISDLRDLLRTAGGEELSSRLTPDDAQKLLPVAVSVLKRRLGTDLNPAIYSLDITTAKILAYLSHFAMDEVLQDESLEGVLEEVKKGFDLLPVHQAALRRAKHLLSSVHMTVRFLDLHSNNIIENAFSEILSVLWHINATDYLHMLLKGYFPAGTHFYVLTPVPAWYNVIERMSSTDPLVFNVWMQLNQSSKVRNVFGRVRRFTFPREYESKLKLRRLVEGVRFFVFSTLHDYLRYFLQLNWNRLLFVGGSSVLPVVFVVGSDLEFPGFRYISYQPLT